MLEFVFVSFLKEFDSFNIQYSVLCLQDEVLAISDKVVIRAADLLNWCDDTINWRWGLRATTTRNDPIMGMKPTSDIIKSELDENESKMKPVDMDSESSGVRSLKNSLLDFNDINTEKGKWKTLKNLH